MHWRSQLLVLVFLAIPHFVVGCSSREPRLVPVTGIISFEGKECPAAGYIYFAALKPAPDMPNQPGNAHFETDGRFEVTTISSGNGLFPGTYRIRVECWKQVPTELAKGVSYVPANYHVPDLVVSADDPKPIQLKLDVSSGEGTDPK